MKNLSQDRVIPTVIRIRYLPNTYKATICDYTNMLGAAGIETGTKRLILTAIYCCAIAITEGERKT